MKENEHVNEQSKLASYKIANTDHEIYALLKQRYSPRIFSTKEVTENDLGQLFEAVRWAASSSNGQPWRFIYGIKGSKGYEKILDCLDPFNKDWAVNAPVLMLTAYREKNEEGKVNFHGQHDLGLSLGNMSVQAQYMGIALHHMAGVDWKKAQKDFGVPENFHVSTVIALGYYGGSLQNLNEDLQKQEGSKRERIPQEEFAFKNGWKS